MSEKKRKRSAENGEGSKKKAAAVPKGTVRVEMLENKETLGPLLGMRRAFLRSLQTCFEGL
jgi:DNA-directed RNA polymerase I subunit RPA49